MPHDEGYQSTQGAGNTPQKGRSVERKKRRCSVPERWYHWLLVYIMFCGP